VQAYLSTHPALQCPCLLHDQPKRMTKQVMEGKLHKFAMKGYDQNQPVKISYKS
jgi:hypothetical protein